MISSHGLGSRRTRAKGLLQRPNVVQGPLGIRPQQDLLDLGIIIRQDHRAQVLDHKLG